MRKRFIFLLIACIPALSAPGQVITTVAGSGTWGSSGDCGPAISAELNNPHGIAVDTAGNLYIADYGNNKVRKVSSLGIIVTIAGTGVRGNNGDNIPATAAELNGPLGLAVDRSGNVYIVDHDNNRIRMVNAAGMITTVAGGGGSTGNGVPATDAEIIWPAGVTIDDSGNMYIADMINSTVRKVNAAGIINTVAGIGADCYYGDGGPATRACLSEPNSVAVDKAGNIYIADDGNYCIRKVDASGIITTIAGTGTAGFGGDNGPATLAQFHDMGGISIDAMGNLYVPDYLNNRIRKITGGIISTIAGTGVQSYNGDNRPATSADLNLPSGVAINKNGDIYICDESNVRIRLVKSTLSAYSVARIQDIINIYPNPSNGKFTINICSTSDKYAHVVIYNSVGTAVKTMVIDANKDVSIDLDAPAGSYILSVIASEGECSRQITVSNY